MLINIIKYLLFKLLCFNFLEKKNTLYQNLPFFKSNYGRLNNKEAPKNYNSFLDVVICFLNKLIDFYI